MISDASADLPAARRHRSAVAPGAARLLPGARGEGASGRGTRGHAPAPRGAFRRPAARARDRAGIRRARAHTAPGALLGRAGGRAPAAGKGSR